MYFAAMIEKVRPGLGELLRYVGELVERGAEEEYRAMDASYRARYTPALRALAAGAQTISDVTARTNLTQGAVSQTIGLIVEDGLVERHALPDGRKSGLRLTGRGRNLLLELAARWAVTFEAIEALEREIGHPLLQALELAARALERESFAARLRAARVEADRESADAE